MEKSGRQTAHINEDQVYPGCEDYERRVQTIMLKYNIVLFLLYGIIIVAIVNIYHKYINCI